VGDSNVSLNMITHRILKIHGTIILSVVVYGCETLPLTLREKCRKRVFENRLLSRIFGPKRDKIRVEWRKIHNEELNNLSSPLNITRVNKSRRMRGEGHVARMGRKEVYKGVW